MINFLINSLTVAIFLWVAVIGVGLYLIFGVIKPEHDLAEACASQGQFAEATYHNINALTTLVVIWFIISVVPSSKR